MMLLRFFSWMKRPESLLVRWRNIFLMPRDCLGNQTLEFDIQAYDDYDEMIQALQDREIDMIFYAGRNPYLAEQRIYTYQYSLDLQFDGSNG